MDNRTLQMCTAGICSPGGFVIADRAAVYCSIGHGSQVADIGCGTGATAHHLAIRYGADTVGIDTNQELIAIAQSRYPNIKFICADAHCLPFEPSQMDALFFECSMSKIGFTLNLLTSCNRILKNKGSLIISDVTASGNEAKLSGLLGQLLHTDTYLAALKDSGFEIILTEDYTMFLNELWGQMIMERGADELYGNIGVSRQHLKSIKPRYTLIIAEKRTSL